MPTRFIEWFTDVKSYTNQPSSSSQNVQTLTSYFLRNIIQNGNEKNIHTISSKILFFLGYYAQMCSVIQSKVPPDVSKTSRVPAIETIVELLARPIEYQLPDSSVR